MSLPARCRHCRQTFLAQGIVGGYVGDITFTDCTTSCPFCGGTADIQSGTYDFVDGAITAFTSPGMTRQKVEQFKAIAESVKEGGKDAQDAYSEIVEIDLNFAPIWNQVNENAGALGLLVAIITLILSHWHWQSSNDSTREVEERNAIALEKIAEELESQRLSSVKTATNSRSD